MPEISIRWRLVIGYGVVLTAVLAGLALFVYRLQESWLIDEAESRVRTQVAFVLRAGEASGAPADESTIEDIVMALGGIETSVAVLDPDGAVVAEAGDGQRAPVDEAAVESAAQGDTARDIVDGENGRRMALLLPVRNSNGDVTAVLQATVSLENVDATLDRLQVLLVIGVVAAHVLALLLIFAVTTWSLSPLDRMVEICRGIARGEYGQRAALPKGGDELGELGRAFDVMIDEVQDTVARKERSEQLTRQFAADASHELKSPLTVISGYVDVLLRGGAEDAEGQERALIGIQRETDRMSRLVADLLALAELEGGNLPMQRELIDLASLVRDVHAEARSRIEDRDLSVGVESPASVVADTDSLRRALRNLIDNAVRHTGSGGAIALRLSGDNGEAVVTVTDDGEGIDERHLAHVFERFYRADPARGREGGSTGLGLAITRAIVQAHGGRISVESAPGEGTRFTIRLPLVTPEGVSEPVRQSAGVPGVALRQEA